MSEEHQNHFNDEYPDIQEEASPRSREAYINQFDNAMEAMFELVDNAIDNRVTGIIEDIQIRVNKNEIYIVNSGGKGLDYEGLRRFFRWGESSQIGKDRIGRYGVGGKAAMGYLGRTMEVVCSPYNSDTQFRVFDPDWKQIQAWATHKVQSSKISDNGGSFRVRVTNLDREIKQNVLIPRLAEVYRPVLLAGEVKIKVNGKDVTAQPLDFKSTLV